MTTNIKEFKGLLKLTQEELHEYLCEILPSYYEEDKIIDQYGSFLYCQGEIPVLMVAHLDTVHKKAPTNIFYDSEQGIMWSPEGIGGDDRCGVWSILELLDRGLLPSIVFTWNEECGALGASDFCTLLQPGDLEHINFAIEIDRRNNMDCVFYDLDYPEFEKFIEQFNYKTTWGSFSDISLICPHFGFAGVNLSAGYFEEHTLQEYIDVRGMEYTIERVSKILTDADSQKRWEWKGYDYGSKYKSGGKYSKAYGYGWDYEDYDDYGTNWYYDEHGIKDDKKKNNKIFEWCITCQSLVENVNMAPKPYNDMCLDCYKKLEITEEYCQNCGEVTSIDDMADFPNEMICKKCFEELVKFDDSKKEQTDYYCDVCHILENELDMYELNGKLVCRECFEELNRAAE